MFLNKKTSPKHRHNISNYQKPTDHIMAEIELQVLVTCLFILVRLLLVTCSFNTCEALAEKLRSFISFIYFPLRPPLHVLELCLKHSHFWHFIVLTLFPLWYSSHGLSTPPFHCWRHDNRQIFKFRRNMSLSGTRLMIKKRYGKL